MPFSRRWLHQCWQWQEFNRWRLKSLLCKGQTHDRGHRKACSSHKPTKPTASTIYTKPSKILYVVVIRCGLTRQHLHSLLQSGTRDTQKMDSSSHYHSVTLPWVPSVATFITTELSVSKSNISTQVLNLMAEIIIMSASPDDSVDPNAYRCQFSF